MASQPVESEEGDHSSDEDFSPGQLVIDMDEEDEASEQKRQQGMLQGTKGDQHSTPSSTPGPESPAVPMPAVNRGITPEDTFKGLTFVGRMDVSQPTDDKDTVCLYSYHWGPIHIDIITRKVGPTLIPVKNVYGRVVPGLTRNAVSNRIPKIGAKTVALPDPHINTLKKLQLPITARSHYLTVDDFVRLCHYYKKPPPSNLASFTLVSANDNPAEVLKTFNAQKPSAPHPMMATQPTHQPPPPPNGIKLEASCSQSSEFSLMSPGQINANLANSFGHALQYATPYPIWNAPPPLQAPPTSSTTKPQTDTGSEFHSLVLPDGNQIALVIQNSTPYLLNAELQQLLPQANQNVIGPLRSLLNIPLEYASRPNMNALKEVGIIGIKACRAIVYKVSDVLKMYAHWRAPVPRFLHDINNGKIPKGIVDMTPVALPMESCQTPPTSTPINTVMMSPSGVRINLGSPKLERRNSHSGQPPLDDQFVVYEYLSWGADRTVTLLKLPSGEPYIAIAELVDKIFGQRSQVSLQKRTKLGIPTVPATSLQIHALRARGSIDPSSGYSKLVSLSGVIRLAREAGIFVPQNVYEECQKYLTVPLESLLSTPAPPTPPKAPPDRTSSSPLHPPSTATPPLEGSYAPTKPVPSSFPQLKEDVLKHPDVILPTKYGIRSAEGVLYQVKWDQSKIVIFTSARGISYVGLYQIYDALYKHKVSRMNFKMRMRKLGIKSIRAPPTIRLSLIKLGALPTSSPVCGLLRISEMDRLVRSYDMVPPKVFHDLYLSKKNEPATASDIYKDFCNPPSSSSSSSKKILAPPLHQHTMELVPHLSSSKGFQGRPDDSLVVSLPRALVTVQHPQSQMVFHSHPQIVLQPHSNKPTLGKGSILQNLAKKISQKNHKLAAAAAVSGKEAATRECSSCGRVYPLAKKRCESCRIYLVGSPCPSCGSINYSRCSQCTNCGHPLDTSITVKSLRESGAIERFKEAEAQQESSFETMNTTFSSTDELQEHDDSKSSEFSENDSTSPTSAVFSAPPIRTAVLKKMFPDQQQTRSISTASSATVVTRTVYTGTAGSTRKCLECGAINAKMSKKCQQCKAPLQGRPCPRCSRPNHSHSTECYKCGAPLPPSATKWIVGGRIVRASNEGSIVSGMTSTQLNKEVSRRAPITCIRCHRMKQKGRFKCGRCGDLYSLSPLVDSSGKIIKRKKHDHTHHSSGKDAADFSQEILSFSHNLYMLGVGPELASVLTEKEQQYWKMLSPVEEELAVAEEEYQKIADVKSEKEMEFSDVQAGLDALIVAMEKTTSQLSSLKRMEEEAETTISSLPGTIQNLEKRLAAIEKLL